MRLLIVGGTFNPVHCGHMHLAIEACESLACTRVIWVPARAPHYRAETDLLPFDLRMDLLRAACSDMADIQVSDIEASQPGLCYSYDTIELICAQTPRPDPVFAVGMDQLVRMRTWYRGSDLPALTDLAVAGRDDMDLPAFHRVVREGWPEAHPVEPPAGTRAAYQMAGGHHIILLASPRLDISASMVRARWVEGRSIRLLVPDAVLTVLNRNRELVTAIWESGNRTIVPVSEAGRCQGKDGLDEGD